MIYPWFCDVPSCDQTAHRTHEEARRCVRQARDADDRGDREVPPPLDAFDLDAFGHLSWGVGYFDDAAPEERGDWTAWADCDAQHGWVGYHVVIDSDSGGFCDGSLDMGVMAPDEAEAELPGLLDKWLDVASEHLGASGHWFTETETEENQRAIADWRGKVAEVVAEARKQCEGDA